MSAEVSIELTTLRLIVYFASLLFALVALILSFAIVWKAEKRLDHVYKVLTVALSVFVISQIWSILVLINAVPAVAGLDELFDVTFIFIVMISLVVMNKTLKDVWKEKLAGTREKYLKDK